MENQTEALRLKTLAEETYTSSPSSLSTALSYASSALSLSPSLENLSELHTALKILSFTKKQPPNWYSVFSTEPFSQNTNFIKKQYRKLALTLHPDKSPFSACEEAFKHVAEGFRVLSDKSLRREYDVRLRVAMHDDVAREREGEGDDGFWTACGGCGSVRQIGKRYLGHSLVCSICKKRFRALEVGFENKGCESRTGELGSDDNSNSSNVLRSKRGKGSERNRDKSRRGLKRRKMSSVGEVLEKPMPGNGELGSDNNSNNNNRGLRLEKGKGRRGLNESKLKRVEISEDEITVAEVFERSMTTNGELGSDDNNNRELRLKRGKGMRGSDESKLIRVEIGEDEITLAEVLGRSMAGNGELGNRKNRELKSKRGVDTRGSDESKPKTAEIGEDEITLAEVLERSKSGIGELGSRKNSELRSKRGMGTRVLDESKRKMAEIGEDEITLAEVLERSMPGIGELGSRKSRKFRSKRGVGTRRSDEFESKTAEIGEDGITLAEVLERSKARDDELDTDNNNKEFRSKREKGKKVSDESELRRVEISEDEITLAEVFERVIPRNGNLGSDNKVSRLKKRVRTKVLDESQSNRAEIEEQEITLVEEFERSLPVTGELGSEDRVLRSKRVVARRVSDEFELKRTEISEDDITLAEVLERSMQENGEMDNNSRVLRSKRRESMRVSDNSKSNGAAIEEEGIILTEVLGSSIPENGELGDNNRVLRSKRGVGTRFSDESESKRSKIVKERTTLAEMQMLVKKKVREEKMRLRGKEKRKEGERVEKVCENKKRRKVSENGGLEIMAVEDSDFYDFDKDRVERSFKKGQVWAVYDDDDGMPRHYGLIDDVSVYPFKIKLNFLDPYSNANEMLLSWDKTGVLMSCGRFKLAKKVLIDSVNIFSHFVDAERATREVYRIYPKKGSVWALFNENASQNSNRICYDIVMCLTSFDETYGLSMGYLEKVDGFKTVFKRREIGSHAIRWLAKAEFRLFSHQIPARKLSGEEAPELSKDCWELDPASLPPELLMIGTSD